jgi:uncharacterized membrane protein/Mg-chelatase subunit ChlD
VLDFLKDWSAVVYVAAGIWGVAEAAARFGRVPALAPLRRNDGWVMAVRAVLTLALIAVSAADAAGRYRFGRPWVLWLLALIPLTAALSMRSLAGLGGSRRALAVTLRCVCLLILIAALADIQKRRDSDDAAVIVLLDVSSSVPEDLQREAIAAVNEWAGKAKGNDAVKVIVFASDSQTETPFLKKLRIYDLQRLPKRRDQTDLAAAIRLAMDSYPPDTRRRLVIISDGNQNVGDARAEAVAAAARRIPIDTVTLNYGAGIAAGDNEVLVDSVRAPASAFENETVDVTIGLRSLRDCRVRLRLFEDDREIDVSDGTRPPDKSRIVELEGGPGSRGRLTTVVIPRPILGPGLHRWRVEAAPVEPALSDGRRADVRPQNNVGSAVTEVSGRPSVLVVTTDPDADKQLINVLRAARNRDPNVAGAGEPSFRVTIITPDQLPEKAGLFAFDAVLFSNVPASAVPKVRHEEIEQYVKEAGGGFVMIGGDASFGAGDWKGTPVEKALPVDMDVKNLKVRQQGALVLVMHSSEMPEGNHWAQVVAEEALKSMSRLDYVGVIDYEGGAGFNWVVPFQQKLNEARVLALLRQMRMGDMPDLDAICQQAYKALTDPAHPGSRAANKHMIVISDGDPQMPNATLVAALRAAKITISCVAVTPHSTQSGQGGPGAGADCVGFKRLVDATNQEGRGKFYIVDDNYRKRVSPKITIDGQTFDVRGAQELPQIFLQETKLVRRPLIRNVPEGFQPTPEPATEDLLRGIDAGSLRPLRGYVLTSRKPQATVRLVGPPDPETKGEPEPVLAYWKNGIGKSVAWTSDARPKWAADWMGDYPEFGRMWEQIVRWVQRPRQDPDIQVGLVREGDQGRINLIAVDRSRRVRGDLAFTARVLFPDGKSREVPLVPTVAGGMTGVFRLEGKGPYFAMASYEQAGSTSGARGLVRAAMDVAYEDEYRTWTANPALMSALADVSGGKALAGLTAGEFAGLDIFRREGLAEAESWHSLAFSWEIRKSGGLLAKAYDVFANMPLPGWLAVIFLLDVLVRRVVIDPKAVAGWFAVVLRRMFRIPAPAGGPESMDALKARRREVDRQMAPAADRPAPQGQRRPPPPDIPPAPDGGPPPPQTPPAAPPAASGPAEPPAAMGDLARLRAAKKRARDDLENRDK